MKTTVFMEQIVEKRIKKCKELLTGKKDKEYSREGDKFHNFKKAARLDQESPEKSLYGMWKKHIVSISDLVQDIEQGVFLLTEENIKLIEEKMTDNHNYLFLLEGLIMERQMP